MAITCDTSGFDLSGLMKPLMMKAVLTEGEMNIDVFINVMVQEKMEQSLLSSITLPEDFSDLQDVICMMLQMDKLKGITAAMKGEAPPEGAGLDKIINLVVQLQMLSALEGAFGGGGGSGGGG